jgi:hypothetical protein
MNTDIDIAMNLNANLDMNIDINVYIRAVYLHMITDMSISRAIALLVPFFADDVTSYFNNLHIFFGPLESDRHS